MSGDPRLPVYQGEIEDKHVVAGGFFSTSTDEEWHDNLAKLLNVIGAAMRETWRK